jgi:flagellar biosynthesis/type III secretory pathway chaperone
VVVRLARHYFNLLGNTNKNIEIAERWKELTHEIDTPNFKELNNKNICKRHHVSSRNIIHVLASITWFKTYGHHEKE